VEHYLEALPDEPVSRKSRRLRFVVSRKSAFLESSSPTIQPEERMI